MKIYNSTRFLLHLLVLTLLFVSALSFISAYYIGEVYFTVPDTVYTVGERIEFTGYVFQANYSNNGTVISTRAMVSGASVNFTITNLNGTKSSNNTFTTNGAGMFHSRSNYNTTALLVNASSVPGTYYLRAEYKDPNQTICFSRVEITVVNQSVDTLRVSSQKARYYALESVKVEVEAVKQIGDKTLHVANVSVNGTLRNSSKGILQNFNCTTGNSGKCRVFLTAPSTVGSYELELNNYKTSNSFLVVPFSYSVYMKDELGESYKNIYAINEQARVEVRVSNASTDDVYTFSGSITNSSGSVIFPITSTTLNTNNSFINSFLFTVDTLNFSYGSYLSSVTVTKTGDGSMSSSVPFRIEDWSLAMNKKSSNSGFEYEYSAFTNKTLYFELIPSYRSNGSVITNLNVSSFSITVKDNLNNLVSTANVSWNATCSSSGCYEFFFNASGNAGKYAVATTLSNAGSIQTESRIINVIGGVTSAQSTDKDGNLKELFGTNEYVYLTLLTYNLTSIQFNLSEAEVFSVTYMNSTEYTYSQVSGPDLVNASNSVYEWAWNSTTQRLKLDVLNYGGLYNVYIFGNNRSFGASAKFIVNPYDVCSAAKDTAGTVTTGQNYYVWQFKTSDTVYFELKITQANNPLGRATAMNSTTGNGTGQGAQCTVDTQTKQVISNASITILEVKNLESGAIQSTNITDSVCQASDSSGGYSCTVKPLSKWEGGVNSVKFNIQGTDGTNSIAYSRFEARAFYLYGWSQVWQNSPSSNLTLSINIYEAGSGWWGGGGTSGGLGGTITLKKIEYQGRDGEWIWPPVDSGYNVSNVSSVAITSGYSTMVIPVSAVPSGRWKTGYYRAVLQATTTSGDTDYGYAWFGVKLWDVYGTPIECNSYGCSYKYYFNSKENVTLYIKISQAGSYNYNDAGGGNIWGNVSIGIKKIENCKTWPCKELNATDYTATSINVNQSSPWYWGANQNQSRYMLRINTSKGTWGTAYYNVVLDVNGTDTGYAWFGTIAFYVNTKPTNATGVDYKYSIRGNQVMYFNISTTKSYKSGYYYGNSYQQYNSTDLINTTIDDAVLKIWDSVTYKYKEYNYPEDLNITPLSVNGTSLVNITYKNGTWPSGYYWGELNFKNLENESATGWLSFSVQPFRVSLSTSTYTYDSDQCVNATISIYDADYYSSSYLWGNYSVIGVTENIWNYGTYTVRNYTNYTSTSFNATSSALFCPNPGNSGNWQSGNWGGYHYFNVLVRDNVQNDTQTGWLYFNVIPFKINWIGAGGVKNSSQNVILVPNITRASSNAPVSGNLTAIYQWRDDNSGSRKEFYIFKVGNCFSNVSGQCKITGTQDNITVYAPTGGWRVGYNYINTFWTQENDPSSTLDSSTYFESREAYNGYFNYADAEGNWKYYFASNENLTIKLFVRDSGYNSAGTVNITRVEYALPSSSCTYESCRSYTSVPSGYFSPTSTSGGTAILKIRPTSPWVKGTYYIRATVTGSLGTATITGGTLSVKDFSPPNVTIIFPVINGTYNLSRPLSVYLTTLKSARCQLMLSNYNNFYNYFCGSWNTTNSTTPNINRSAFIESCNITKYGYNGTIYRNEYIYSDYRYVYNATANIYNSGTFIMTGGTTHNFTFNMTSMQTMPVQNYGLRAYCEDSDYNSATEYAAFKVNITGT